MSNQEKDRFNSHENFNEGALAEHGREHREKLREDRERAAEKSHEQGAEKARHEALEQASRIEKEKKYHETLEKSPAERRGPTKREKQASYNATMREVRSHMSAPSRAFSKVIHNPAVEKVSDAVGGTVARPNAILAGSLLAFLFTLGIYLVARMNGYPLSGTETIAAFILGWVIGIVYDYLRVMIMGRR